MNNGLQIGDREEKYLINNTSNAQRNSRTHIIQPTNACITKEKNMQESFEKTPPPPMADDRSTKKAKFRAQSDAGETSERLSFRDQLMKSQKDTKDEMFGSDEDIELKSEDVIVMNNDSMPSITFSPKVHEQLIKPWQNTVVVKLLGRRIGYRALCNRLESLWNLTPGFNIIDLENEFYLVRFKNAGDADYVLTSGPWTVIGHYLTVQPWSPHFDSSEGEIDKVVAWIRLPGMALHYYHKQILRRLGQIIGSVIRIDYTTESA